jgi:hypothetical protein
MCAQSLVEVWGNNNKASILVQPTYNNDGLVINGGYTILRCKNKNEIYIYYTEQSHECYYYGDVYFDDDYNETMRKFNETGEIVGINLIPVKLRTTKEQESNEPPF